MREEAGDGRFPGALIALLKWVGFLLGTGLAGWLLYRLFGIRKSRRQPGLVEETRESLFSWSRANQDLSSLIHLADHIAWTSGNPSTIGTPTPPMDNEIYDHVGLDPQQVEDLLPQIQEDYKATGLPW